MTTHDSGQRTESLTPSGSPNQPLKLKLIVASGPDFGRELLLERGTYRIGKDDSNELVLADTAVSRTHLRVEVLPSGARLIDNDSTNGSFLDGMRFSTIDAKPGAVVKIGRTELKLAPVTERPAAVPPSTNTRFGDLVGHSLVMRELFATLERIARADSDVLIQGETGTGKDLCARAIHQNSRRAKAPFVVCDLASVQPNLIESELFGHVRGAFTGATGEREGLFEKAHGGTLFIDEVGELPLELQPRLLRALEQKQVRRVGGSDYLPADVRVISATHRDLRQKVAEKTFREDLLHRLDVLVVKLPPLRERSEDIPHLVDAILAKMGKEPSLLSPETRALFAQHAWPGNVRELRNVVERAVYLGGEVALGTENKRLARGGGPIADASKPFKESLDEIVNAFEKDYVADLLKRFDGNVSKAAEAAGIGRNVLSRLVRKHNLTK